MSRRAVTKHDGVIAGDLLVLTENLESDNGHDYIAYTGDIGIVIDIAPENRATEDVVTCHILVPGGSARSRIFVNEVVRFFDKDA